MKPINSEVLFEEIRSLLIQAKINVEKRVNSEMVTTYYLIGSTIVNYLQDGNERADYGKSVIKNLSIELKKEFGRGFSVDNLLNMRMFYLKYSKSETLSRNSDGSPIFQLSWSHYLKLLKIDNEDERNFYRLEAINANWSIRELQRQTDSALYERLVLSTDKDGVRSLNTNGQILNNPGDAIKEPYVLEFLGLEQSSKYSESELENAIIDKLEHFLLELGKGFTFVARQKRISFDDKHFHIDLVFYNRLLKCFILIDLKIGELKHQDIGQMQMYVNYFDREIKLSEEYSTIGLILCKYKSDTLIEYTLPQGDKQIFASKYQTVLPSKEALRELIQNKNSSD